MGALLSTPAILTGIVLSSVLMQRNSPVTHMVVTQTRLMAHQVADSGRAELYQVQMIRCNRWTVLVKSRHSFVLWTMYHNPNELKHNKLYSQHSANEYCFYQFKALKKKAAINNFPPTLFGFNSEKLKIWSRLLGESAMSEKTVIQRPRET